MKKGIKARAGYILLETVVAMVILSLGVVGIQGAIRQTIYMRGRATDITRAKFLLEKLVNELEVRTLLDVSKKRGTFNGTFPRLTMSDTTEYDRFSWEYDISKVPVPQIEELNLPAEFVDKMIVDFIVKITATVKWSRGDIKYEETVETILGKNKLVKDG